MSRSAAWLSKVFLCLVNRSWFQSKTSIQADKYSTAAPKPIVTNKNDAKSPTTNSAVTVVQALSSEPNCATRTTPIRTITSVTTVAPFPAPGTVLTWVLVFPALFDPDVMNTPLYQQRSDAARFAQVSGQLYLLVSILFPSFVSSTRWDAFVVQNQAADIVEMLGAIALASTPPMHFGTTPILPEISG